MSQRVDQNARILRAVQADWGELIGGVRLGDATNSSSTHNVILVSPDHRQDVDDALSAVPRPVRDYYRGDDPVYVTREEKLDYLWSCLARQLMLSTKPLLQGFPWGTHGRSVPAVLQAAWGASYVLQHTPKVLVEEGQPKLMFPVEVLRYFSEDRDISQVAPEIPLEEIPELPGMDSDGSWNFPVDSLGVIHIDFARWLRDRILSDEVVIHIGSDEDSSTVGDLLDVTGWAFLDKLSAHFSAGVEGRLIARPYRPSFRALASLSGTGESPAIAADMGGYWLLWNRTERSGTTLRLRLRKELGGVMPAFGQMPELADVHITDYCTMGCSYCYMGSTRAGKHAQVDWDFAWVLKRAGVCEVALGGGEPVNHPHFGQIVYTLYNNDISVNVTTRTPFKIPLETVNLLSSIGLSVDSRAAMQRFQAGVTRRSRQGDFGWALRERITFHITLGAVPMAELISMLQWAAQHRYPVLLLGYKTDGRGATAPMHPHDDWVKQLVVAFERKDMPVGAETWWGGPQISVDTAIVDRWGADLQEHLGVRDYMICSPEGAFSMYVDLVSAPEKMLLSRSSYGEGKREVTEVRTAQDILRVFQSWHEE